MNVDLEVRSRRSLQPLADALGERASQLYVGRVGWHYGAYFELALSYSKDADALIVALVRLVRGLSQVGRQAWAHAFRRDFNIGIQAGLRPRSFELALKPETLNLVRAVHARLVITVYGANVPTSSAAEPPATREPLSTRVQPGPAAGARRAPRRAR